MASMQSCSQKQSVLLLANGQRILLLLFLLHHLQRDKFLCTAFFLQVCLEHLTPQCIHTNELCTVFQQSDTRSSFFNIF